jgi:peptide/nickel transport system ATP-binding protein
MYAGRIVEKASAASLFANVRHPYTEALLQSIPKLEQPSHTRLEAIGGRPPDLVNLPEGCKFAPRCKYARDICLTDEPELIPVPDDPTHLVACHVPFPLDGVSVPLGRTGAAVSGDAAAGKGLGTTTAGTAAPSSAPAGSPASGTSQPPSEGATAPDPDSGGSLRDALGTAGTPGNPPPPGAPEAGTAGDA